MPFSGPEWAQVPDELKVGLDVRESVSVFDRPLWVPFKPGYLPTQYGQFIFLADLGAAMQGGNEKEEAGSCPFASAEKGCLIYDQRPILCRLFGTSTTALLACKRGLTKECLLSDAQVMEIMRIWFLL